MEVEGAAAPRVSGGGGAGEGSRAGAGLEEEGLGSWASATFRFFGCGSAAGDAMIGLPRGEFDDGSATADWRLSPALPWD